MNSLVAHICLTKYASGIPSNDRSYDAPVCFTKTAINVTAEMMTPKKGFVIMIEDNATYRFYIFR